MAAARCAGLAVQNLRQPMLDVAMDTIVLGLVEDFVSSAGVEPVLEFRLALPQVAGDEFLDRRGLGADGIIGPGDEQDRQVDRDPRFVLEKPQTAGRKADIRVLYALHHRYRPGDYETWKYIAPIQKAAWPRKTFEYGTWGGEIRAEFEPQPGDIVAQGHWGSSWFANTDLDLQLKKHGIHQLIVMATPARRPARQSDGSTARLRSRGSTIAPGEQSEHGVDGVAVTHSALLDPRADTLGHRKSA
jgi:hypothetical protein